MREIITLQCPECKNRNYSTTKNKKTHVLGVGASEAVAFAEV